MVESAGARSGCRTCSVRSPCTCRSRTVGILEIAGIQAPVRGLLSGARTICSIPSGKSQCVEGGVIFADWWSRQCAFKLSILTHVGHSRGSPSLFVFLGFPTFFFFFFPNLSNLSTFPFCFLCVCACVCVSRMYVRAYLAISCVSAHDNVKHTKSKIRYDNKINKMKQM